MSNPFIPNLVNKTTPVGNDLFIIADSQDSNLEKNTKISQVITNNDIVTQSGSATSGNLPVLGGSNQIKDSGISVDTSRNVTNVNSLALAGDPATALQAATKQYTDTKLAIANNLSDVGSAQESFSNIAPANPAKGELIYFNGTNWVGLGIGQENYIAKVSGGVPIWSSPPSTEGFVDNTLFSSTAGQTITNTGTLSPINLSAMTQYTAGNHWIPAGDNAGMKCMVAGTYLFSGNIAIQVTSNTSANYGAVYGGFSTQAGGPYGLSVPIKLMTYQAIGWIPVQAIITCSVGTIVFLGVKSVVPTATYSVADPATLDGSASYCSITRLT